MTTPVTQGPAGRRPDPLDVSLGDDELWSELQLLGELMVAAGAATGHLDQAHVDRLMSLH